MHPMFVKLFLQASKDDLLAEEDDRWRAANLWVPKTVSPMRPYSS